MSGRVDEWSWCAALERDDGDKDALDCEVC